MTIEGRVVIVTGAGKGIGKTCATIMAEKISKFIIDTMEKKKHETKYYIHS